MHLYLGYPQDLVLAIYKEPISNKKALKLNVSGLFDFNR